MTDRFESYLRSAADLVKKGDYSRAEGFERLALETLERLDSPPRLMSKLYAQRGERAMRQADYPLAEDAFAEALAALREAGGGGRELFELLHRLGQARAHRGADERALTAFDDAIAVSNSIGPAFYPVAYLHLARAESLRRLARRADAEESLRAAIAVADHAPGEDRERIALHARAALEALRPGSGRDRDDRTSARDERFIDEEDRFTDGDDRSSGSDDRSTARREAAAGRTGSSARTRPPRRPGDTLQFDETAFNAVLAELDELIGLVTVKAEVQRLAELLRIATLRREAGLKTVTVSLHLVFQGGAGTGKTTVARLFGRLYQSLGLLATDHVIEITREDLVSGYVGQTATKTNEVIDSALDGVLFLDEAYALVRPDSHGDFGPEAVVELLKRMEDERDRLAVIAAGYPHEMTEFLATNSGFRSRFGETIHFDDYGPAELVRILEKFATDADYTLSPEARAELQLVMERLHAARDRFFGNARTARNLFDDIVAHQAERLLSTGTPPDRAALMELTLADVKAASGQPQAPPEEPSDLEPSAGLPSGKEAGAEAPDAPPPDA